MAATSEPASGSDSGIADRKSTRLNSSHTVISYAVFCLKKKKEENTLMLRSVETLAIQPALAAEHLSGLLNPPGPRELAKRSRQCVRPYCFVYTRIKTNQ